MLQEPVVGKVVNTKNKWRVKKMSENKEEYIEELESAFIDVLDGDSSWYDIQANTGLSEIRCKEISKLFNVVLKKYEKRHNISG